MLLRGVPLTLPFAVLVTFSQVMDHGQPARLREIRGEMLI